MLDPRWIGDRQISDAERGKHVQFWADTHTTGGTATGVETGRSFYEIIGRSHACSNTRYHVKGFEGR